jgi:hypothetical protein
LIHHPYNQQHVISLYLYLYYLLFRIKNVRLFSVNLLQPFQHYPKYFIRCFIFESNPKQTWMYPIYAWTTLRL